MRVIAMDGRFWPNLRNVSTDHAPGWNSAKLTRLE
jgi:hypothetical protein